MTQDAAPASDRHLLGPALGVAIVAISFAAIFFRKAAPTHPAVMSGLRLLMASLVLLPVTARALRDGRLRGRALGAAALAGVAYGVHFAAWVSSLSLTTVAASVTLVTSTPLLLAVWGTLRGRDRPDRRLWLALALAAIGVSTLAGTDFGRGGAALLGDALALLGAVAMAAYLLLARGLGPALDVAAFSGVATGVGAALLLGFAAATGIPLRPASGDALLWIAAAALVPQLVGHTILTWALRHSRPAVVGMATVGEPVGATILGWLLLGEAVSPSTALGCAIMLTSVVLALARSR
jgi:drug/metabolite transporter (DMT)-like permease